MFFTFDLFEVRMHHTDLMQLIVFVFGPKPSSNMNFPLCVMLGI